jgi:hypothetical protein
MGRVRHQPDRILGGSITRAPNGYRAIIQTTAAESAPKVIQEIYANASQRLYPPKWDGIVPEGHQVIYLTDPIQITSGCCHTNLGSYVAYKADRHYGLVEHTARHRHPRESFPPSHFRSSPHDRFEPAKRRFWYGGDGGAGAGKTTAVFRCLRCGLEYTRNLRRLGEELFETRPSSYVLKP